MILDFSKPKVMGILNITPDSFFDGNRYITETAILKRVEQMNREGADIIDIGAFSSRPGAQLVSYELERQRLMPVLVSIKKHFPDILISIDTYRSQIAREAIERGAHIINDISAGNLDNDMFATIAALNVPYIMMHMQGIPENMQNNPYYDNIVSELLAFFKQKIGLLKTYGFDKIIIDPGFGFGKTIDQNYQLLKHLAAFKKLGFPVLAGISRKSMLYKLLQITPDEALNATAVANTVALLNGADILRVHDVKQAVETVKIVEQLKRV